MPGYLHPTAEVDPRAAVGEGTAIWNWAKVREGARIGAGCTIGQSVYVDHDVTMGDGCKVQNGVSLYYGLTVGHAVFIGPNATFTNDMVPRAFNDEWKITPTVVEDFASIGANATIVCGLTIGRAAMIGAGAVVTRDVPAHALVVGNPARIIDYVTLKGERLHRDPANPPRADELAALEATNGRNRGTTNG